MDIQKIITDLEESLTLMQVKIDILKTVEFGTMYTVDMMLTRKEAACYLGISTRQIDRLCELHKIKKVMTAAGVRIPKNSVQEYKGLIISPLKQAKSKLYESEFEHFINKYL